MIQPRQYQLFFPDGTQTSVNSLGRGPWNYIFGMQVIELLSKTIGRGGAIFSNNSWLWKDGFSQRKPRNDEQILIGRKVGKKIAEERSSRNDIAAVLGKCLQELEEEVTALRAGVGRGKHKLDPLFSSKKEDWGTPKDYFEVLHAQYKFAIDACANEFNHLLDDYISEAEDSLKVSWWDRCNTLAKLFTKETQRWVYCNPPYTKKFTYNWVEKAYYEMVFSNTCSILLLPSRTDVKWYHDFVYQKEGVSLKNLKGRLKFIDLEYEKATGKKKGGAPFPSVEVKFERPDFVTEEIRQLWYATEHEKTRARAEELGVRLLIPELRLFDPTIKRVPFYAEESFDEVRPAPNPYHFDPNEPDPPLPGSIIPAEEPSLFDFLK